MLSQSDQSNFLTRLINLKFKKIINYIHEVNMSSNREKSSLW